MKDFLQSKIFKAVLLGLGGLAVFLLIFQFGVFVGTRKAGFACGWGENYGRNFGMPPMNPLGRLEGREFFGGHGLTGTIIKIENGALIIKDRDNLEKVVNLLPNTLVRKGPQVLLGTDIKVDDQIMVIGSPGTDGTVSAKMIRVFDPDDFPPMPAPMMNNNINRK